MSTFEIVRGVEGDCLVLDNTRICGPKPWGGGRIIKTFHTDGIYEVIYKDEYRKLQAENAKLRAARDVWQENDAKLRELVRDLLQPILAHGFDCYGCVYEDCCDGMQYTDRCKLLDRARELGVEVDG